MRLLKRTLSAVLLLAMTKQLMASPQITHTRKGPTGYEVTFRYKDPAAKRVQIKGEWYFADPTQLPSRSTYGNAVPTPGLLPKDWKPGFFPIQSPNNNGANFPVIDMVKGRDGTWTFTTPLPSGVFNYSFYVNCEEPAQKGCSAMSDPGNPPWNEAGGARAGSLQRRSQVYVPSDAAFGTIDYSWQAPSAIARGQLAIVAYRSPISLEPNSDNYLAVYTPPGYDAKRATPYPTLYLAHGNGENELAWSTSGVAGNILDNLITTGQIKPMVVVMPGDAGLPGRREGGGYDQAPYSQNLVNTIIPYIESHYHVSTSPSERAMAGLSQGSGITNFLLFNRTDKFAYYGSFSRGPSFGVPSAASLTAQQIAALKQVQGIFVGAGWEEMLHPYSTAMIATLTNVGVTTTPQFVHGGHSWPVWRMLLRDFLTKVAFFPSVSEECQQCVVSVER